VIETIKVGEVETKVVEEVKTTDDLKVLIRIGWGAETSSTLAFKPAEALKVGDGLRVTIEKLYEVTEPEPEPEEVTAEAAAGEAAESTGAEGEGEAGAEGVSEPVKMEGEEGVAAGEAPEPPQSEDEAADTTEET